MHHRERSPILQHRALVLHGVASSAKAWTIARAWVASTVRCRFQRSVRTPASGRIKAAGICARSRPRPAAARSGSAGADEPDRGDLLYHGILEVQSPRPFSRGNYHATGPWPATLFLGGHHEPRSIRRADSTARQRRHRPGR